MKKLKKHCTKRIATISIILFFNSCATKIITKPNLKWTFPDDQNACLNQDELIKLKEYIKSLK